VSFGEPSLRFSPDSTFLASGERNASGRPASVVVYDLTQDPPSALELTLNGTYDGSGVFELGWSAHSTELALAVRTGTYPATVNLYVISRDSLLPGLVSVQSVTGYYSCDQSGVGPCQQVFSFQFQP
jgi:hypothetical protein